VDLIIINDGMYNLVPVTKAMLEHISLLVKVDCFQLCEIIRLEFTTYHDAPFNYHAMNDGSGYLAGCVCR
jgi:hypothetical protein|tara:strand:- start:211 stop:420 length:210 start_codon:yes stop_codon:yes gene_type:complete